MRRRTAGGISMVKRIVNAASWLSLVQLMNMLSVIVLSVVVIRQSAPADVAAYMYAVFLTDAVMSYTLLQIAQRITLAKNDSAFGQLFAYSKLFGMANAALAVLVVAVVAFAAGDAQPQQALAFIGWLTLAGMANYFAQIGFSVCDYSFDFRSFGVSSAISNVLSLALAVTVFACGGGIFSMVLRDVARGLILLALAVRTARALAPELRNGAPLDRRGRVELLVFLVKRHTLKVIEVTNHRVPALVMSAGNLTSLGHFGVAFQLISQIMNVLTVAGDKLAYAFFSRGEQASKRRFLMGVVALYAATGALVFLFGERLFNLVYGAQWREASTTFSLLGLYLFTHGSLVVITNYLITEQRFAGIYVAWCGWTLSFAACFLYDRHWPIVAYYLCASAVSFVLVVASLMLQQVRSPQEALGRAL